MYKQCENVENVNDTLGKVKKKKKRFLPRESHLVWGSFQNVTPTLNKGPLYRFSVFSWNMTEDLKTF